MELAGRLFYSTVAWITIVAGLAVATWWLVALYWMRSRDAEQERSQLQLPEGLAEIHDGVPGAIVSFLVFLGLSMLGYVFYIWLAGISY